jgi:hypothetical protein
LRKGDIVGMEENDRLIGEARELHVDARDYVGYVALELINRGGG